MVLQVWVSSARAEWSSEMALFTCLGLCWNDWVLSLCGLSCNKLAQASSCGGLRISPTTNGASPSTGTLFKPLLTSHLLMFLFGQTIQKVQFQDWRNILYILRGGTTKHMGKHLFITALSVIKTTTTNGGEIQHPRVEDLLSNIEHSYNGIKCNIYK